MISSKTLSHSSRLYSASWLSKVLRLIIVTWWLPQLHISWPHLTTYKGRKQWGIQCSQKTCPYLPFSSYSGKKNPSQKFYLPAEFLVCLISQIWVTWPRIAIRESGKEASICLPRWEADKKDKHWLGVALAKRVCHNTLPALDQLGQQEQTQIEIVLIFQHWACG